MQIPFGLLIPGGTGTASTLWDIYQAWKLNKSAGTSGLNAMRMGVMRTSGIDIFKKSGEAGRWDPMEAHFTIGWIVGAITTLVVGTKLKVNQKLGRAKVPFFRV